MLFKRPRHSSANVLAPNFETDSPKLLVVKDDDNETE
jgi:hypothetical protein